MGSPSSTFKNLSGLTGLQESSMSQPIRPRHSFVIQLWREPDAEEGDAGWRGVVRPLDDNEQAVWFHDFSELGEVIRPFLTQAPLNQQIE